MRVDTEREGHSTLFQDRANPFAIYEDAGRSSKFGGIGVAIESGRTTGKECGGEDRHARYPRGTNACRLGHMSIRFDRESTNAVSFAALKRSEVLGVTRLSIGSID